MLPGLRSFAESLNRGTPGLRGSASARVAAGLCYDEPMPATVAVAALDEFRRWLTERFGARLNELKLFGSRARGEAREDSDYDVLVAVDDLTSAEARSIAHFTGDLFTVHGVVVSAFAVSTGRMRELRERERLIAHEIDRDGVALNHDRG